MMCSSYWFGAKTRNKKKTKNKSNLPLKVVADNKIRNKPGSNDGIKDKRHTCYRFSEKIARTIILSKQSFSQKSKVLGLK